MSSQSCSPYRGFAIDVRVTPARSHALMRTCRCYRVSWAVSAREDPDREMASFSEQFEFLTEHEAFNYAEKRAHAYIDSVLSTPSHERRKADFSGHADASAHL